MIFRALGATPVNFRATDGELGARFVVGTFGTEIRDAINSACKMDGRVQH
jgi:hypothetical protein